MLSRYKLVVCGCILLCSLAVSSCTSGDEYMADSSCSVSVDERETEVVPGIDAPVDTWYDQDTGIWLGADSLHIVAVGKGDERGKPGSVVGILHENGKVSAKLLWRRDDSLARGRLRVVSSRERNGREGSVRVLPLPDRRRGKIIPSTAVFPSTGCWLVEVEAGNARLLATFKVDKAGGMG